MELKVQTNYIEDLVLHCLAHMHVDNESDLYDICYISKINEEKLKKSFPTHLDDQMEKLSRIYNDNFERMAAINFLPFTTNSLDELEGSLLTLPIFTEQDREIFIHHFIEILKSEDVFYHNLWANKVSQHSKTLEKFEIDVKAMFEKLPTAFQKIPIPLCISLQLAMTKAGRATANHERISVAVRLYEDYEKMKFSLLQVLHELTHMFTDRLLKCQLSMRDGSHMKAEYIVIVTDYLIIEEHMPEFMSTYLEYIDIKSAELKEVLEVYPVEEDTLRKISEMLHLQIQ
ncbi:hypothetical protein [Oceanirhabdus sp. W0125-5]|uniref:hypothetical protein n=1 Tax=Oceanirhabdus sp. W0125-5 TaxID=2999116 RepID=UPI0022F31B9B|nr:hypothetical protein [Oceanirhabdus sp. W0125-5]WBW99276.1 hypothetical protein OW730_11145 [Oceanirhabdus sp. W0125-5]